VNASVDNWNDGVYINIPTLKSVREEDWLKEEYELSLGNSKAFTQNQNIILFIICITSFLLTALF